MDEHVNTDCVVIGWDGDDNSNGDDKVTDKMSPIISSVVQFRSSSVCWGVGLIVHIGDV